MKQLIFFFKCHKLFPNTYNLTTHRFSCDKDSEEESVGDVGVVGSLLDSTTASVGREVGCKGARPLFNDLLVTYSTYKAFTQNITLSI